MCVQSMLRRFAARAGFEALLEASANAGRRAMPAPHEGPEPATHPGRQPAIDAVQSLDDGPARVGSLDEFERELMEADEAPLSAEAEAEVAAMLASFEMENADVHADVGQE